MSVNHPKIFTSKKLSNRLGLFGLKSFHKYFILGERIKPIVYLVFYLAIKIWENLCKKANQI